MARGPRGARPPEDPAQAAVMVVWLATGEINEERSDPIRAKDPSAVAKGRRGGLQGGVSLASQHVRFL